MTRAIISLIFSIFFFDASAELRKPTGSLLFELCSSDPGSHAYVSCGFYVTGFIRGARTAVAAAENYKSGILCLPSELSGTEAIAVFLRRSKALEDEKFRVVMKEDADIVLAALLAAAYPCPKNPN